MRIATHERLVGGGLPLCGLLEQAEEKETASLRSPSIESEGELVEIIVEVRGRVTAVGPGDVLFCAAHVAHGFEDISGDFSVWVLFYGQQK